MPASHDVHDLFQFAFAAALVIAALLALIERQSRITSGREAIPAGVQREVPPDASRPELVTAECGPFWAHEDCDDPDCGCGCHRLPGAA